MLIRITIASSWRLANYYRALRPWYLQMRTQISGFELQGSKFLVIYICDFFLLVRTTPKCELSVSVSYWWKKFLYIRLFYSIGHICQPILAKFCDQKPHVYTWSHSPSRSVFILYHVTERTAENCYDSKCFRIWQKAGSYACFAVSDTGASDRTVLLNLQNIIFREYSFPQKYFKLPSKIM